MKFNVISWHSFSRGSERAGGSARMQAAGNGQSQDVQWDRGQLLEDRHRWQPRRWVPAHHAWLLPRSGVGLFFRCHPRLSHALHGWQSRTTPQEAQTEAQMIGTASAPYPPRPEGPWCSSRQQETRTCTVGAIRGDTELRYREILSTI